MVCARYFMLLPLLLTCSFGSPAYAAEISEDIPMTFVKGGCFVMGDRFGDGSVDERPPHEVCVDDFYLGTYEVTEAQWLKIMGDTLQGTRRGAEFPTTGVSWKDVREFSRRLNEKTGRFYRLPTEAEWEYAARGGGKQHKYAGTDNVAGLKDTSWYETNSGNAPHPVGQKLANELGLFDMNGNVWEWINDRYDSYYYRQSPRLNPTGDPFGVNRILRGGSFNSKSIQLRTSYRDYVSPEVRRDDIGFRLLLQPR